MRKRTLLVALVGVGMLLSTASLLAGLRHALGRREHAEPDLDPREAERRRIREALGDVVAPLDLSQWPEHLRGGADLPDRDTLRRSMPRTDRPAWHILREERDSD